VLIVTAIVVFVIFTSIRQLADTWTDYLWFDSTHLSSVWKTSVLIKFELGALFSALFFLSLWLNLLVADRISPKFRPLGPDEELLNRYHQIIDRRAGTVRIVVALIFAFITGAGMSSQWNEWILFREGGDFTTVDPQFGLNVGFYVFRLPFLVNLVDWLFAAQIIILLITAVAHYLNGGIRLQAPFERVTPQVKAHLSVLLALLALTKAADYWLQRYQILFSDRSNIINGATYTEINAQLPALYLLLFIALASFVLFLLNIRRRGWVLPVVAVGLWAFVAVVVGAAYPAIYERIIVQPEQSTKEAGPIANNIQATREAYGLDKVDVKDFSYSATTEDAVKAVNENPQITRNIQLLDPKRINETFQKLQSQVSPSAFAAVDTDRYPMKVDGPDQPAQPTQVVISNREVNPETIPQKSWEGQTLSYTHGYGLALSAGNAVTQGGSPTFAVRDIPVTVTPDIDLKIEEPNNYYFSPDTLGGQSTLRYSIVKTGAPEFDYVRQTSDANFKYHGDSGVQLDSFARKLAFALKFNDPNIVISQYISEESRILYLRRVTERVATVAPFLNFDLNPYPVVVKGHTSYVIDAYTTTDMYPDSQRYSGSANVMGSDGRVHPFNYIRNSVKAVVDTYDGSISLYIVDKNDPIINAYAATFPDLFKERKDMDQSLIPHLRYPEAIFTVQTDMWGRYHITDPNDFYKKENAWEPPPAPPTEPTNNAAAVANAAQQQAAPPFGNASQTAAPRAARMAPYYVLNKLQGDADPNYMILRPFQPFSDNDSKPKLTAFMVARCDGDDLGRLQVYTMGDKENIDGPGIVSPSMLSDSAVSSTITQLNQQGSKVYFGDLTIVPMDKSIIYVRALYVVTNEQQQLPVVRRVIVRMATSTKVVIRDTLRDALKDLLPGSDPKTLEGAADVTNPGAGGVLPNPSSGGGTSLPGNGTSVPSTSGTSPSTTPTTTGPGTEAEQLIASANKDLADAQQAYDQKDLTTYVRKVDEATRKIQQAQTLFAGQSQPTDSTTTTAPSTTIPTA
jgi:uncharacterized membrane protein (UPF0182 family)